ncbi:hypothetical protein ACFHW1_05030 [Micromonospora sp. LOL_014]|uniref:hypothetical protein n=1 Tax=Micromonospora sp. LOL_014 TaxID=3345415 RepID=UPI003A885FD7
MTQTCVTDGCGRPVDGQAYACTSCADRAARDLDQIADLADAAHDVATGQTRRGPAVHGSGDSARLPIRLEVMARLDSATTAVTTWARHIASERGIHPPSAAVGRRSPRPEGDRVGQSGRDDLSGPLEAAARWLPAHLEWARHRREWPELARDIHAAARLVRAITDRPADRQLVGACQCGEVLYARAHARTVDCGECAAVWDVDASRQALLDHLGDRLLTAAEIAGLAVVQDPERDRQRVRRHINVWAGRGPVRGIAQRGQTTDGQPLYQVREVLARIAQAEARAAERLAS